VRDWKWRLPARRQADREPRAAERASAEPMARSSQPPAARESAVPAECEPVAANGARTDGGVALARATSLENSDATAEIR
jgi:hypothetical protein